MKRCVILSTLCLTVAHILPAMQSKLIVRHSATVTDVLSNSLYDRYNNSNKNNAYDNELSNDRQTMADQVAQGLHRNTVDNIELWHTNSKPVYAGNWRKNEKYAAEEGASDFDESHVAAVKERTTTAAAAAVAAVHNKHQQSSISKNAKQAAANRQKIMQAKVKRKIPAKSKMKTKTKATLVQATTNYWSSKPATAVTPVSALAAASAVSAAKATKPTTTAITALGTEVWQQLTPYTNNNRQHHNNQLHHKNNGNRAHLSHTLSYPFGQLATIFSNDQFHLQDYTLLFNAERHTIFQLHTTLSKREARAAMAKQPTSGIIGGGMGAEITSQNSTEAVVRGRVVNVVSGSINAAFGVNAVMSADAPPMRVEEVQLYNAASLRQSRFNPFNPTRILIHGWFGGSHAGVYKTLIPAYLKLHKGTYNVFTVDWGRGAFADYITASYRVKPVGKVVAKFIDFLHQEAGIAYEDLHVIGFSMGAHIAGIAGKYVQTGRLPVIYALDPALPFFRYDAIDERISLVDADYVEVIHTSVGSYGYDQPLGHVDFYLNYGSSQPGCFLNECSHMRAFQVFAESLHSSVGFYGEGCDVQLWRDLVRYRRCPMGTGLRMKMGGDPKNVTALKGRGGVFNVMTNANSPYAKA